jgi:hypothetical protein
MHGVPIVLFVFALMALLSGSARAAVDRPAPQATAHALDELANACAQRKPECPTSTPSPTLPPTSTFTPVPSATPVPTATAESVPLELPDEPCWRVDHDLGDPDSGYIVFDETGASEPCPNDEVTEEPPTDTPTPAPTATPRPPAPQAPPAQVVVRNVVQTVVVTATPGEATRAPTATFTLVPTVTPSPTHTLVPTRIPTRTLAPTLAPTGTPVPPVPRPAGPSQSESVGHWDWFVFAKGAAIVAFIVLLLLALISRRRVAVWRGQ